MIIQNKNWRRMREQFSEAEKAELREVIQGHMLRPPGVMIAEDRLREELLRKVSEALLAALNTHQRRR